MKYILILGFLAFANLNATDSHSIILPEFNYDKKITTFLQEYINRQAKKAVEEKTHTLSTINTFRNDQQTKYLPYIKNKVKVNLTFDNKKINKNLQKLISVLARVLIAAGELSSENAQIFASAEEERLSTAKKNFESKKSGKRKKPKEDNPEQREEHLEGQREKRKNLKEKNPEEHKKRLEEQREKRKNLKEKNPEEHKKLLKKQREYYKNLKEKNPEEHKKLLEKQREKRKNLKEKNPEEHKKLLKKQREYYKNLKEKNPEEHKKLLEKQREKQREYRKNLKDNPEKYKEFLDKRREKREHLKNNNPAEYEKRLKKKKEYYKTHPKEYEEHLKKNREYYKNLQENYSDKYTQYLEKKREYRRKLNDARHAILAGEENAHNDAQHRLQSMLTSDHPQSPIPQDVAAILASLSASGNSQDITQLAHAEPGTPAYQLFDSLYNSDDTDEETDTDIESLDFSEEIEILDSSEGEVNSYEETTVAVGNKRTQKKDDNPKPSKCSKVYASGSIF